MLMWDRDRGYHYFTWRRINVQHDALPVPVRALSFRRPPSSRRGEALWQREAAGSGSPRGGGLVLRVVRGDADAFGSGAAAVESAAGFGRRAVVRSCGCLGRPKEMPDSWVKPQCWLFLADCSQRAKSAASLRRLHL